LGGAILAMIARNSVGKKWRRAITSKLDTTMDIVRSNVMK
jgi:hypothetical protein